MHSDWMVPQWSAPANVHALCTTRAGGVSLPPCDSLNLGDHVGDDPAAVRANRAVLGHALSGVTSGARPVFLTQVHGTTVAHLQGDSPDGMHADACVSTERGVVCTIMVADCLPVLLAHRNGAAVGAAHAGWRGLAGTAGVGVLESAVQRFATVVPGSSAADLVAWLGPCIGPRAFEVGPEVRAAFCDADPAADAWFQRQSGDGSRFLADLAGLARHRLRAMGVTQLAGNDSTDDWCTVGNPSRFFSHRRDTAVRGRTGRFAACVWLG